jgi:hypothetical protein
MANVTIDQLVALGSLTDDDLLLAMDSPAVGASTRKITVAIVRAYMEANALQRANHTGTQAESTITNLVADLAAKAADAAVVHLAGSETISGTKAFAATPTVPDQVYGVGWSGSVETPTKNAVYNKIQSIVPVSDGDKGDVVVSSGGTVWLLDTLITTDIASRAVNTAVVHNTGAESVAGVKTFSSTPVVPDDPYAVGWNGNFEVPTKNAVYDQIQLIVGGSGLTQQQVLGIASFKGF